MATIDLSSPKAQSAVLLQDTGVGAPQQDLLAGAELRAAIRRLAADSKSNGEIAEALGCSRAYASRIRNRTDEPAKMGRPVTVAVASFPSGVLRAMQESLREGLRGYDIALLRIPGVAECFTIADAPTDPDKLFERRRSEIRKVVAVGGRVGEGQAHQLWLARQEGLLRKSVAAA